MPINRRALAFYSGVFVFSILMINVIFIMVCCLFSVLGLYYISNYAFLLQLDFIIFI